MSDTPARVPASPLCYCDRLRAAGGGNARCGVCAQAEIARLTAACAALRWQPIKTSPKDGQTVIIYFPQEGQNESFVTTAGWNGQMWSFGVGFLTHVEPTHWMPLPAPPDELAARLASVPPSTTEKEEEKTFTQGR